MKKYLTLMVFNILLLVPLCSVAADEINCVWENNLLVPAWFSTSCNNTCRNPGFTQLKDVTYTIEHDTGNISWNCAWNYQDGPVAHGSFVRIEE